MEKSKIENSTKKVVSDDEYIKEYDENLAKMNYFEKMGIVEEQDEHNSSGIFF